MDTILLFTVSRQWGMKLKWHMDFNGEPKMCRHSCFSGQDVRVISIHVGNMGFGHYDGAREFWSLSRTYQWDDSINDVGDPITYWEWELTRIWPLNQPWFHINWTIIRAFLNNYPSNLYIWILNPFHSGPILNNKEGWTIKHGTNNRASLYLNVKRKV